MAPTSTTGVQQGSHAALVNPYTFDVIMVNKPSYFTTCSSILTPCNAWGLENMVLYTKCSENRGLVVHLYMYNNLQLGVK